MSNTVFRRCLSRAADPEQTAPTARRGQALLFLIMAVTILTFLLLWTLDLHRLIGLKTKSQHGGDAAALAAARWQASTLNLIGELNLMKALALATDNPDAVETLTGIQARLCFSGPMAGLIAAQVAAKNNRLYAIPDFSEHLQTHASRVRQTYRAAFGNDMLFPEPYPGAWNDYAGMLETAAAHGIAAGPDNAHFLTDRTGDHPLLNPGFYDAIAGRDWCWFYLHAPGLLEAYTDYRWWPDLPAMGSPSTHNSEIFSLGLQPRSVSLAQQLDESTLLRAAEDQGIGMAGFDFESDGTIQTTWYCYDDQVWGSWSQMDTGGDDPFPATGPVLPQFDYAGADAAVRVLAETDPFMTPPEDTGQHRAITWTAAAKPFGWLEGNRRPNAFGLVLPAFRQVRLIPVDASSAPEAGAFDLTWRRHVADHLPLYLQFGPQDTYCWYCARLRTWEDPAFRQQGVDWLSLFSYRCTLTTPPGGRRGGGRRRGH